MRGTPQAEETIRALTRTLSEVLVAENLPEAIAAITKLLQANPSLLGLPGVKDALAAGIALGRGVPDNGFIQMMASQPSAAEGVKLLRLTMQLSCTEVGRLTGFADSLVSRWEAGIVPVPPAALAALFNEMCRRGLNPSKIEAVPQATGRDLRQLRKALKLTQKQLAELVGVRQGNISRWEAGDMMPSAAVVKVRTAARSQGHDFPAAV
jgi:transcriptional regulator with XRE-family HTH domain